MQELKCVRAKEHKDALAQESDGAEVQKYKGARA